MWKRKKKRTIEDVSVIKLLDDFVDLDVEDDSKRARDMDDDAYIRMMVEKEDKMKRERAKQNPPSGNQEYSEPQSDTYEPHCESDMSPEDEAVIEEIMKTQDVKEIPELTGRMKIATEFLQHEVRANESRQQARETLEKYRKDLPSIKKKKEAPVISEKLSPVKSCQICYFCIGERKVSGSCWCNCSNPARSSHAINRGSWVMSRLNLPCWKPMQD